MLTVVFLTALLCYGGFHTWSRCLTGLIVAGCILVNALDDRKKIKISFLTPLLLALLIVLVTPVSIDAGRNIEGIITALVLVGWELLVSIKDKETEKMLAAIPIAGAVMTVVSGISYFDKYFRSFLWQADRMGGIFQYSNTMAIFLLAGIIIEAESSRKKALKLTLIAILVAGIMLTGSRSVMLILVVWAAYKFVVKKESRIAIAGFGTASIIGAAIFVAVTGSVQNVGRITTLLTSNSTVWGRILYNIDGLKMLTRHPLGMGYMGYYYVQGSEQTGVYSTMFVHNDFLQICLDYGIITGIIFVMFLVGQLIKGKQSRLKKEVLASILAGCFVDFHLQYLAIGMLVIACFDTEYDLSVFGRFNLTAKEQKMAGRNRYNNTSAIVIASASLLLAGYLLIAYGAMDSNPDTTIKMLPFNTKAMENKLRTIGDIDEADEMSDRILRINKYSKGASNTKIYVYGQRGEADKVEEAITEFLRLDPYTVTKYISCSKSLANLSSSASSRGDEELARRYDDINEKLPVMLKNMEQHTSPIAYRLKDKPVFEY